MPPQLPHSLSQRFFPFLLLQAGLTLRGWLAGLELLLDLGAHVLLHREQRWGLGRAVPRAPVPFLSPSPWPVLPPGPAGPALG